MTRYTTIAVILLLAGTLGSCGGGGGDAGSGPADSSGAGGGAGAAGGGGGTAATSAQTGALPGMHVEQSDPAVTFSTNPITLTSDWTDANTALGWSGGSAKQASRAGATATIRFTGTSIRWLGSRGRTMGIATVSIDGGPAKDVDLFARPADEAHSDVIVINDLSDGPHTLTITVTDRMNGSALGTTVVVDAFDIQPTTTISHWQDTDPNASFSAGWTKSAGGYPWSGDGVSNPPDLPVTAQEATTAGASVTIPFRGTAISWVGYVGPDGGIATVQVDGGAPTQVDTYSPTAKFQPVVFTAAGLADTNHTFTITATGQKNAASTAARIVVDAWDVFTPGRRYEENNPAVTFSDNWSLRDTRVWSEGRSLVSNVTGATATFRFTGTSVSWIGCEKSSAGGTANVFIDGVFQRAVNLHQSYPIEGYQMTVFRADGLPPGPHTLTVEVTSTGGSYVVVDAFDVR